MVFRRMIGEIMTGLGFVTSEQLREALKTQRKMIDDISLPEHLQRHSLISKSRLMADKRPMLGTILTDLGFVNKKQLDHALKEQKKAIHVYNGLDSKKLGTAIEVGSIINSSLNIIKVLTRIMLHAKQVTDSAASTMMLLDDQTGELVFSVPTGPNAEELIDIRLPAAKGIEGWVVQNEQPILLTDAKSDPRFCSEIENIRGIETKSILCVPLLAKSKLIGILEVINKVNGSIFTEEDTLLLSIFASQAAMAIENARLYSELEERLTETEKMHKRLAESEKLNALGNMASGIAHDFNNILTAVMGYCELAQLQMTNQPKAHKSINQVLKASDRAKNLVKQILTFGRQSEAMLIPVQLDQVINEALKLLRASLPATIEIRHLLTVQAGTVLADSTQIHQVLLNLCTNALHAMQESGGILEIALAPVTLKEYEVAPYPDLKHGPYVKMTVSDSGHGMDKSTLTKIFDPYFTTKDKGVGTGMGLSVVHGIIRDHGGTITVYSEPGKGTTFNVFLPRIDKSVQTETEMAELLPLGEERILFVDDEEALVNLGKTMLEQLGYQVVSKTGPVEALDTFRSQPEDFDVVITDLTMPQMTGVEFSENCLDVRADIPIILCSGFSEMIEQDRTKMVGIRAYVMKPLLMTDLAKTIRNVLDPKPAGLIAVN